MNDLIVIGGGLAGLSAAAWCAREGLRVVLLERSGRLGGRARTEVRAGFAHNLGGHALYVGAQAHRGLRDLGVAFTGAPPPAGLLGLSGGRLHRFPAGFFSMLATDLFGFGAKVEAARALMKLTRTEPEPLRDVPWGEWLEELAPREEVRAAIDAVARVTTYTNAPGIASAGATVAQIRRGASAGVLYLDGGWQTLVDGIERAAVTAGVRIVRDAAAASVVRAGSSPRDPGTLRVTVATGEDVAGRAVLLATGPATARTLLGNESIGAGLIPTHAACLDLGLSALPYPDRLVAFGLDAPTYFSVHSASAALASRGALIHLMKYLPPGDGGDDTRAERELEAVADHVQPGWRGHLVTRRFLPRLVSSNGLVAARARRPAVDATGVPGAYLAGDWVGDEGMLADAAMASARAAATRICCDLQGSRDSTEHGDALSGRAAARATMAAS
jgi:phytoene dehydrogenase-like protein